MKGVVFDLDGTLVDTVPTILSAYAETIRALGGPAVTPDDVLASFHVGPTAVLLEHFLGRPVSRDDVERYFDAYEATVAGLRPFPGVKELVSELEGNYPLGVCTTATRRITDAVLEETGLGPAFDAVVCGDEVARPKPAPEPLEAVCRGFGVRPAEVAFVGDSPADLECAAAAGALGVRAGWATGEGAETGGGPVAIEPRDVLALLEVS